ncbi:MAG TPA: hypothetical protein DGG94_07470 [Micromonosporaceae bacterium]|nr:hypothetical protein [Micromonosporaceae bacterium]HCU49625.1 hypothetical protein [Micromonosporaceae bacterium]
MNASLALILLVLSVLLVAWGVTALVRRSRAIRDPRPRQAISWQSPVWNVIGVLAGVLGAIAGIIGLFK